MSDIVDPNQNLMTNLFLFKCIINGQIKTVFTGWAKINKNGCYYDGKWFSHLKKYFANWPCIAFLLLEKTNCLLDTGVRYCKFISPTATPNDQRSLIHSLSQLISIWNLNLIRKYVCVVICNFLFLFSLGASHVVLPYSTKG